MNMGLPRNIIESGYVREQGFGVKVRWEGRVVGEDGADKSVWGSE
jgi:hypothetical protein